MSRKPKRNRTKFPRKLACADELDEDLNDEEAEERHTGEREPHAHAAGSRDHERAETQ